MRVRASTDLHIDPWVTPQLNTDRGEEWSVAQKQKECMIWLEWSQCCILSKFYRPPYQMPQVNNGTGSSVSSSNIIRHTDERSPEKDVWNKTENVHRCCCAIRNASSFAVKGDFETLVKLLNRVDQLSWRLLQLMVNEPLWPSPCFLHSFHSVSWARVPAFAV